MKNNKFLMLFIFALVFTSCEKREQEKLNVINKKSDSKIFIDLPTFEDNVENFLNNDSDAIEKLKAGKIIPCKSISALLVYELKDCDEDSCLKIVKLAIENNGQIVNSLDLTSPLIEACNKNYYKLTNYLLTTEAKKYINYPFSTFGAPLYYAINNGNVELVELLLKNGADPNGHTSFNINYMEHINSFIEKNKMTRNTGEKIKKLLIHYGFINNTSDVE